MNKLLLIKSLIPCLLFLLQTIIEIYNSESPLPNLLEILMENAKKNIPGNRGNRYSTHVKELSSYFYARGDKHFYNFMSKNLSLPELSSVQKHMHKNLKFFYEGELRFDELKVFLENSDLTLEVGVYYDGTKINPRVDYHSASNTLTGLVAPLNQSTGLPTVHFFKADTAANIKNAIECNERATYIQVIMVKSNDTNSPPFLLGFFGTDNKFNQGDVSSLCQHITNELKKREINVLCHGSDGDPRFLCAQKIMIDYGKITSFGNLKLAGKLDSELVGCQDGLHATKKMNDRLYDLGTDLILGNRIATVNHLIMVYKKFPKSLHQLILSDIDTSDHMNYK